ncbi:MULTISPECIES: site-specific integrase [Pelosinus]|uniref:Integrase family protein n=1 Tax=Pelosinus fermentans B4 TaxID=1149862 RepID=I9AZM3_9FIRM|nr:MULTISPECIES: site-specific integrase [Pelosinus]EIW18317.1 integrase family protein [Pelosinus fermentans B4]EIW24303.1 integrase family protein [Pelosinus fermentans A11]OAM94251.1 integrase family protein [Pelosinus fermentans DSM 17108]SDR04113.1 Site-specific recombinase XerD [Pelosinus fermentans]
MKTSSISSYITNFLSVYLPTQRNVSQNTIFSYCDAFRLFLTYCRDQRGIAPERFSIEQFDSSLVGGFLGWLETERGCGVSTRNQRQAAIQSFSRYVLVEAPQYMTACQKILQIPIKKKPHPTVHYLTTNDMQLLLSLPDTAKRSGKRDLVLLSVLYDTGARVQENADLTIRDIRLDVPAHVHLTGKGRKSRDIPLLSQTANLIKEYLDEYHLNTRENLSHPLFKNRHGNQLTRSGIAYILKKYAVTVSKQSPLMSQNITPHTLRHTKAMHLLQAGVHLVYIRDILGHVDVATTGIYAKADTEMKRKALEKVGSIIPVDGPSWSKDAELINWLKNFGKNK